MLVGYVVSADPSFDLNAARKLLAEQLPASLVPRLVRVDELPTRTSGKVDRDALPWPPPGGTDTEEAANLGGTTGWLAGLWRDLLGAAVDGPEADFFALGGGSLAAAQLVAMLRQQYPQVTVADLYDHPRLGSLAGFLDELEAAAAGHRACGATNPTADAGRADRAFGAVGDAGGAAMGDVAGAGQQRRPRPASGAVDRGGELVACCGGVRPVRHPAGPDGHRGAVRAHVAVECAAGHLPPRRVGAPAGVVRRAAGRGERRRRTWPGRHGWSYYARALGANVGKGVDLHSMPPVTGLLTLGHRSAVEPEVDLSGHWIDGDAFHVGEITIGDDATVGARTTLLPGAIVGKNADVAPGSGVLDKIKNGQYWKGSPAEKSGRVNHPWPDERPPRRSHWVAVYGVTSLLLGALPLVAVATGLAVIGVAVQHTHRLSQAVLPALPWTPVAALAGFAAYALLTVIAVRSLSIRNARGLPPGAQPHRVAAVDDRAAHGRARAITCSRYTPAC